MAEDYADEYEYVDDDDGGDVGIATDFRDGSRASGVGRGDPGRDEEFTTLQTENKRLAERAAMVDRFEANPEAVLRNIAKDMGMELVPAQQQQQGSQKPPAEFLSRLGERLPEEWKFLGEIIGPALWDTTNEMVKPLEEESKNQKAASRNAEFQAIESQMDDQYPDWRGFLPQMNELYKWIVGSGTGSMRHPKHGNVYEALYKLASGNTAGARQAVNRMRNAAQNATSESDGQAGMGPDLQTQMANEPDRRKRLRMAFRNALSEHGVR